MLTQAALGEAIGRSQSTVQSWEVSGGVEPSLDEFVRIAAALKVTATFIAFGVESSGARPRRAAITAFIDALQKSTAIELYGSIPVDKFIKLVRLELLEQPRRRGADGTESVAA